MNCIRRAAARPRIKARRLEPPCVGPGVGHARVQDPRIPECEGVRAAAVDQIDLDRVVKRDRKPRDVTDVLGVVPIHGEERIVPEHLRPRVGIDVHAAKEAVEAHADGRRPLVVVGDVEQAGVAGVRVRRADGDHQIADVAVARGVVHQVLRGARRHRDVFTLEALDRSGGFVGTQDVDTERRGILSAGGSGPEKCGDGEPSQERGEEACDPIQSGNFMHSLFSLVSRLSVIGSQFSVFSSQF